MRRKFAVKVMAGPKMYIIEAENYEEAFAKARDMLPDEWKRLTASELVTAGAPVAIDCYVP